ncbi:uncharacterized protein LOC111326015 [Stylophora pistillata]|nr:uncharacterized protein LOC111326015 [Stylophora pistillata]
MSEYHDIEGDNYFFNDSSLEVSKEIPRTLFSPVIQISEDSEERDKAAELSNKNNLEVPAVLLSPCVRTSKSEQSLIKGVSKDFLAPPPLPNVSRTSSRPGKLSLSLHSSPSTSEFSLDNDSSVCEDYTAKSESINHADSNSRASFKSADELSLACSCNVQDISVELVRDSSALLNRSGELLTKLNVSSVCLPVARSTPNLHRNRSTCCRNPSKRLCCLIATNYTPLSTPSSEGLTFEFSNQILQEETIDRGNPADEIVPLMVCDTFINRNKSENDLNRLSTTTSKRSSSMGIHSSTPPKNSLHPTTNSTCKQLSTPDLRLYSNPLAISGPRERRSSAKSVASMGDNSKVEQSSERSEKLSGAKLENKSSTFLHPNMAHFSDSNQSSEGSSKSLLEYRPSKALYLKRKKFSDQKLTHASCSINSSTSSAFAGSSGRGETSLMKSFLSLISPSKLLSKFHSSSKHSIRSTNSRSSRRKRPEIDFPDDDKIVILNVSGRRFQIRDYFLSIYPNTLLGGKARNIFYDKLKNEFFFDRDPDSFRYIWNFYHSGQLHCPRDDCVQSFLDEVAFFGLDISMLCECCWFETFEAAYERLNKRREEQEAREKEAAKAVHTIDPNASFREKVWLTLKEPSISLFAKIFYLVSVIAIVISVVANTTETITCEGTIRVCKEENEDTYFYLDTVCVGFFTFEFASRLLTCPNRLKFIINLMSIVDLLAILPYYIDLILNALSLDAQLGMNALVVLRVLRILRIFKLLRHSKRLKQLIQSMKDSATELGLIGFLYMVMVILVSSIIYFAEFSEDTQFTSIPEAMWYAVITSTTAGYGDIIPETLAGRLVGSACCLFGVLVIALPVPILQIK